MSARRSWSVVSAVVVVAVCLAWTKMSLIYRLKKCLDIVLATLDNRWSNGDCLSLIGGNPGR